MYSESANDRVRIGAGKLTSSQVCAFITGAYAILATALLTNFDFNLFGAEKYGLLFNDMAQRLLHLDWTIDPKIIDIDGFHIDGRTYTYWGILPAIPRIPLVLAGLGDIVVARISCILSLTLYVWSNVRLTQVIATTAKSPQTLLLAGLWIASLVFSGPPAYLLNAGWANNEAVFWSAAFAAVFNYVVLSDYFDGRWPEDSRLVWLSALAGMSLLTRAPNGVGLFAAVGLFSLRQLWDWYRHRTTGRLLPIAAVGLILALSIAVAGAVNAGRWGNPLVFAPFEKQQLTASDPRAVRIITQQGMFSVTRIPISALYFASGMPFKARFETLLDEHFSDVEGPRIPLLLVSPLPILFAVWGILALFRRPRPQAVVPTILIGSHLLTFILVLAVPFLAWRYTFDAWGMICASGAIGFASLVKKPQSAKLMTVLVALLLVGISASAFSLIRYKIVSGGVPANVRYSLSRQLQPWVCPNARLTGSVTDFVPLVTPSCPPFW